MSEQHFAAKLILAALYSQQKEGRPEKWTPLAKSTIKQRTKKGYWPGKILQIKGDLAASITSKYDDNSAVVGTNKVYAAIHQFGGDAGRNKKVKIPARPYLKITDNNQKEIIDEIMNYLTWDVICSTWISNSNVWISNP